MSDQVNENGNGVAEEVVEEPKTKTVEDTIDEAGKKATDAAKKTVGTVTDTISEAVKQVEKQVSTISKALGSALQDRANVVMVRVNDDSLHYLDVLVEADMTKSRSESAAFLINEGIKANEALFNKISEITDQIAALKAQLRENVHVD